MSDRPDRRGHAIGGALLAAGVAAAVIGPAIASSGGDAARQGTGALSISPAIVELAAQPGDLGAISVSNATGRAVRITVRARPWTQTRAGHAVPNRRRTLRDVAIGEPRFTLRPGERQAVPLTLLRSPSGSSAYGAIEVIGEPTGNHRRGVTADYRLISSLRLNPPDARRRMTVQARGARVDRRRREVVLTVRNSGNTIEPVTGTARLRGPSGTRILRIAATRIVPGATVDLRLGSARGLPRGPYTATVRLSQGRRRVATASRRFRVR